MQNRGMGSDLLNESFISLANDAPPVGAAVRLRLFNLVGPGEPPSFVASSFATGIAAIEAERMEPPLRTGDLTTKRDFVDVRDAATAIRLALGLDEGVYNVCSGRAVAIRELLEELFDLAGVEVEVESTPEPESVNVRGAAGTAARLHEATGWEPRIPLRQSLADVLDARRGEKPPS